jgi:type II secretory ATPase GspE/PulE/Tfp pilus assembly ATPase PilB-like protein
MTTPANRKRVHTLEKQAATAGIGIDLPLSSTAAHLTHIWQANLNGCPDCRHTGYSGTVGLVEVMPGGEYLYEALTGSTTIPGLQAAALKHSFIPLTLDGFIKALRGETTVTEVVHEAADLLR